MFDIKSKYLSFDKADYQKYRAIMTFLIDN